MTSPYLASAVELDGFREFTFLVSFIFHDVCFCCYCQQSYCSLTHHYLTGTLFSFSFLLGFLCPVMWYYATFLYFGNYYRKDPRERAGLAASAIAVSTPSGAYVHAFFLHVYGNQMQSLACVMMLYVIGLYLKHPLLLSCRMLSLPQMSVLYNECSHIMLIDAGNGMFSGGVDHSGDSTSLVPIFSCTLSKDVWLCNFTFLYCICYLMQI